MSRLSVTHVEDDDSVWGRGHHSAEDGRSASPSNVFCNHLPQAEVFTTPSCSLLMEFVSITQDMSVMMVQKMEVRISMIIAWP